MVRGLEKFRNYFNEFTDRYILIGGTAAALSMEEAAGTFRATKDLDIVLTVETLDTAFTNVFWNFIRDGGYGIREKTIGAPQFYRFYKPLDKSFPEMLELFARVPDTVEYKGEGHLTPIPIGDEVSSLSAILLNDDYYHFIHQYKHTHNGLSYIGAEGLIPLKARAYIDLLARKEKGDLVDSSDIKKHKNDIFRLYTILSPQARFVIGDTIARDLTDAFSILLTDKTIDLKSLHIQGTTIAKVLHELKLMYGLNN
jgi:hypothetical protein